MECERFCSATAGCTAASYYETLVGGKNCWLKKLAAVDCALPADAADDTNATLLLKDTCSAVVAVSTKQYVGHEGKDYIPSTTVARAVDVMVRAPAQATPLLASSEL